MKRLRLLSYIQVFLFILSTLPLLASAQVSGWPDDLGDYTLESIGRSWATKSVLPVYPEEALQKGVEGVVEVRIGISEEGVVGKV
ncbi:MAG: energy transducer TonB [Acidobacteria bacterium]|nr:energy transducer TonB [Acidobacteriota bacterium]